MSDLFYEEDLAAHRAAVAARDPRVGDRVYDVIDPRRLGTLLRLASVGKDFGLVRWDDGIASAIPLRHLRRAS